MTGEQLAKEFEKYLNEGWGYVYGAQGELYSKALAEKWRDEGRNPPNSGWNQKIYFTENCAQWFGKRVADCSGGIVYAIRQYIPGYSDRNANTFKSQFSESGKVSTIPEIRGLALWYSGHIGIYVGNGYAIEFRGTNYGCVKTKISERSWSYWGKIKELDYSNKTKTTGTGGNGDMAKVLKITNPLMRGDDIKALQNALNLLGYSSGTADGICGEKTMDAIGDFSKAQGFSAGSTSLPSSIDVSVKVGSKNYSGNLKG